jgi:HK97 family phage portal protein
MWERVTRRGGSVVEQRALRPPAAGVTPNDTVPPESDPGTVGPPDARPGDPDGVGADESWMTPAPPWPPSIIRPSPWSGWPAEWATPNWWGRAEMMCDVAWAALDLNSSLLATMPPYLVGAAPSLPSAWIDNPDPDHYTSWDEFAKQLFWDYQCGEVYVVATARYDNGFPARFHVVPPWTVNVDLVAGIRRYSIGSLDVTDDMLAVRYKSTVDGARGVGPLDVGRARLVACALLMRYASNFVGSGGIPGAVLTHPDELTAEQAATLQTQWVEARMSSIGLPAVLSGGLSFETLQLSPKDLALVELAQLTESRIAVLLGVPPFLLGLPSGGDSMTYSNVVSIFDYHWRASLRPKAQTVMAALSQWLTPRGTRIEVNRDAYVQPAPLERAQTYEIYSRIRDERGNPVLTRDEIRASERFNLGDPTHLAAGVLR